MSRRKLTLSTWAAQQFEKPPKITTLRNWAASGRILPQPIKVGRDWMVEADAEYIPKQAASQPAANEAEMSPRALGILQTG